jgi:hypothetical protein
MKRLVAAAAVGGAALALGAWRYRAATRGPFEPTHYVWSRGLALLCDKNGGVDFIKRQAGRSRAIAFDPRAYDGIAAGDLVWVRVTRLEQFIREVLPSIREPFALVTGDEDMAIPSGFASSRTLLAHPRLVRWFAQNYDGTDPNPKLQRLPIGLDFHTISNRRKWGHWPATPREQEAELCELVASMPPTRERALTAHADFQFNKHKRTRWGDTRGEVEERLRKNPLVVFQQRKVRRLDLWREKTAHAFVVSPHGEGLDCHRTWESLVLGNIVIVKRSSLDPLYDGLPVVIVDSWDEITRANLEAWRDAHAAAFAAPSVQERLTNRYWIDRMRALVAST